jgi:DNA-binding response OmpR family regulator/DNA-binding CsgD family transcriptional regulator
MPNDLDAHDTILVVDDCTDELGMVVDALGHTRMTALTATSGSAALKLMEKVTPQLVVLDAVMPGLDGFETCRRLKREKRFAHLPVIFMTGLKDKEHVVQGLEAGGVDYITKPVNIDELLARIRVHIRNARMAHGARAALDATGRFLLATDREGQARWCTPQGATLLAETLGMVDTGDLKLPSAVVSQLGTLIAKGTVGAMQPILGGVGDVAVSYLGQSGGDEFLFRLGDDSVHGEERTLIREFGLTARESEVLTWIMRGKSNNEISEILAISPRTVNKHLERVFEKLGVESRAAASSVALRIIAAQK